MADLVYELTVPAMNIAPARSRILEIFRGNIETELKDASPVDHGYLRDHWHSDIHEEQGEIELSNATAYLPWILRGTGLYGPYHQKIVPTTKKALAWKAKLGGGSFVRRSVRGMKPNNFIPGAVQKGADRSMSDLDEWLNGGAL